MASVENSIFEHYQWFNIESICSYASQILKTPISRHSLKELLYTNEQSFSFRLEQTIHDYERTVVDSDLHPFELHDIPLNLKIDQITVGIKTLIADIYPVHDNSLSVINGILQQPNPIETVTIMYTHDINWELKISSYEANVGFVEHLVGQMTQKNNNLLSLPISIGEIGFTRSQFQAFIQHYNGQVSNPNPLPNTDEEKEKPRYIIEGLKILNKLLAEDPKIKQEVAAHEIAEQLNSRNIKNARGGEITTSTAIRHICSTSGLFEERVLAKKRKK